MGEDKDLLLLLTRHLTCRYRLVNVPPVGQDTEIKERLPARPGAALHLMTSELTAAFNPPACPETCKILYMFFTN